MTRQAAVTVPLLDLDLLRTLAAIADAGSFSAAAAQVNRTPSAVSMQVRRLEDMLGRPVFERDSRSVRLTGDGRFLLEHARRMLDLNRAALARFMAPDLQGVVRLGAHEDTAHEVLPAMLRRFAETHPGVAVDVTVEGSVRMAEMQRGGALDLAVISCDAGLRPDGTTEVLRREPLVWAICDGGVAVERRPLPVAVWDESCSWRRAGTAALEAAGWPWRLAFQSAHASGQRAAIRADLAVAPMPRSTLGAGLAEAPAAIGLPALPEVTTLLLRPAKMSPAVAAAVDHLRAAFADG